MAKKLVTPAQPTVTFWGATRSVTGSMHLVQACGINLLLDCGLVEANRAQNLRVNGQFPFRPRDIDAVVLSHAHLDHCGNLPNLLKQGFAGPIYCTPATRALTSIMVCDSARIQEEDADYLNRKRSRNEPKLEPLYDGHHAYRTLLRLQVFDYEQPREILSGLEITFVDAGHLLGSAMIHLRMSGPGKEPTVTYTGDLGRPKIPILRDPSPVPAADLVISECTYGGHFHEPVEETSERLGEVVNRTVERRGKVIIPAFSIGRTQTILYFLHELQAAGKVPQIPVYVDSPMAVRATEVYRSHPECFDEETLALLDRNPELFGEKHVRYVEKVHESIELNKHTDPCIIISASGMCEAGRVVHHLKHNLENPRNTILLAGYQAQGTLGRRLVDRQTEVKILGRLLRVQAEIVALHGLSAHAGHDELLSSLVPLQPFAPALRLVHGEPARADSLRNSLNESGFQDVEAPDRGEQFLFPGSGVS